MDKSKFQTKTEIIDDNIFIIKISNLRSSNAINDQTAKELKAIFKEFDNNPSLHVAVLAGENGKFCSGADLSELHTYCNDFTKVNVTKKIDKETGPLGPTRLTLSKPVIAAVESFAVAGGLELAIWCDLIVSHKEAIFGVFCRRVGVPLIDGGTIKLPKIIGLNRAMDMILTGREVRGEEAYSWGLINRLVEKEKVIDEAINLAKLLCKLPQDCMRNDRLSVLENQCLLSEKKLEMDNTEYKYGTKSLESKELIDGLRNFVVLGLGRSGKAFNNKLFSKF